MKKAVLFFDIDGTVLSEKTKEVPQSAVEALQKAHEAGHQLFINTGRTICSIPEPIKKLPFDGYLCGCGTYLIYEGEVVFSSSIGQKRGAEIVKKIEECNMAAFAEGQEDIYYPEKVTRFVGLEQSRQNFHEKGMGLSAYLESSEIVYDKFFLYKDENSDMEAFEKYVEDELEAIDRGNNTYEVIQKGYTKGTACEYIRKRLGVTMDQIYVFGDSSNDLAMFQYAQHTVAMGYHDPVLEPYTEFITKEVEKDGIAHAMKYYGLI